MDEQSAPTKYWKFVVAFLVIIIVAGGGFFVWSKYFSPEAKLAQQNQENYQKYLDWQKNYETAMKNDTYGGKTPEETLQMFIDALKKGDVELASKYFMPREDGSVDPKWKEALAKMKTENGLPGIIDVLSRAKPDTQAAISKDYYVFSTRDKNGNVTADIDLHINKYSNVWKIESI